MSWPSKFIPISLFAIALVALHFPVPLNSRAPQQSKPTPMLQVDLRQFGYEGPQRIRSKSNDYELLEADIRAGFGDFGLPTLDFIDTATLAVYFERYDTQTGRLSLKLLVVDARTGALRWQQEWPTKPLRWFRGTYDTQSSVMAVHNGRFLVHVNNTLKLYSPEFNLLLERELPLDVRDESKTLHPAPGTGAAFLTMAGDTWAADVAPGGHVAVLKHINGDETAHSWVSVDNLKELRSFTDTMRFVSKSASERALSAFYDKAVRIRTAEKDMQVLCDQTSCRAGSPLFLTHEEILVDKSGGDTQGFMVLSTKGDVLWSREGRFPCNGLLGARRSLDGRRFALLFSICSRKAEFDGLTLPRGEAILVYDRESRSLVFAYRTARIQSSGGGWHYTLSTDGSLLAVRDGTQIAIYKIPDKLVSSHSN